LNVYKFLALPSAQLSGAVGSQMDAFIKSCESLAGTVQSPAHRALAVEAGELGREYQAVFAQLAVSANTLASLVNGPLTQYGAEMRDIARKVSASRRQNMDDVRQASYGDTAWTMGIFIAAALLAIAAGGFIALWIARAVVLPLRGLSETIMRLSSGDTAITVEGTRRQDEIGMLARALEHFRLSILSEIEAQRTLQMESEARCARCKSGQTAPAGTVDTVKGADTTSG
jgi:HAMP domain-containing protein